jgi:preprotein translocase subunit YajC
MFITPAYAQAAATGATDPLTSLVLPVVLCIVVFYFLVLRPQQQKQKDMKKMLDALRRGDKVVTAGGLIGTVTKADTDEVQLEIADGVRVRVVRSTISSVLGQPAAAKKSDAPATAANDKKTPEPPEAGAGGMISLLKGFLGR